MIPDDGYAAGVVTAAWDVIRREFPSVVAVVSTVNHSDVSLELRSSQCCVRTVIPSGMLTGRGESRARSAAERELRHGIWLLLRQPARKRPEG